MLQTYICMKKGLKETKEFAVGNFTFIGLNLQKNQKFADVLIQYTFQNTSIYFRINLEIKGR